MMPKAVARISAFLLFNLSLDWKRLKIANIPPSPWLCARVMKKRYLTPIKRVNDQKMNDVMPKIHSELFVRPGLLSVSEIA